MWIKWWDFFFNAVSNNVRNDQCYFETLTTELFSPPEVKSLDHIWDRCTYGISMDLNHKDICSKSCSPANRNWNISAFLWQLLLNEPCSHKFTEYLCAGVWETGKPTRSCLFMVYWKIELYYLLWSPQAWTKTMTSVLWEMFLSYLHRSLIQSCFSSLLL